MHVPDVVSLHTVTGKPQLAHWVHMGDVLLQKHKGKGQGLGDMQLYYELFCVTYFDIGKKKSNEIVFVFIMDPLGSRYSSWGPAK